jgi:hypothetical protein
MGRLLHRLVRGRFRDEQVRRACALWSCGHCADRPSGPDGPGPPDLPVLHTVSSGHRKGCPRNLSAIGGSPIVLGDAGTPIRIVLRGLQGEVHVAGLTYNGDMPSWSKFGDEQVAAVLTYVRSSWGNNAHAVDAALIKSIRAETAAHVQPGNGPSWKRRQGCTARAAFAESRRES